MTVIDALLVLFALVGVPIALCASAPYDDELDPDNFDAGHLWRESRRRENDPPINERNAS